MQPPFIIRWGLWGFLAVGGGAIINDLMSIPHVLENPVSICSVFILQHEAELDLISSTS